MRNRSAWRRGAAVAGAIAILGFGLAGCAASAAGPATPWEEARLRGVEFRAIGQEPGWLLEVDQARRVHFAGDYGRIRFAAPMLDPVRDRAGDLTFRAQAETHELTALIREAPCQDVMSGEAFSHAVTVRFDGHDLTGCGRTLSTKELTAKYWKLTELNATPAIVAPAASETHIRLFDALLRFPMAVRAFLREVERQS